MEQNVERADPEQDETELADYFLTSMRNIWNNFLKPIFGEYRLHITSIILLLTYWVFGNHAQDIERIRRAIILIWDFIAPHPIIENNPGIVLVFSAIILWHVHDKGEGDFLVGTFAVWQDELVPVLNGISQVLGEAARNVPPVLGKAIRAASKWSGRLVDTAVIEMFPKISIWKIVALLVGATGLSIGVILGWFHSLPFL